MADEIVRTFPGDPPEQDQQPQVPTVNGQQAGNGPVNIVGAPISEAATSAITGGLGTDYPGPETKPLSTSDYVKSQIESAEQRKWYTGEVAEAQAQGTDRESQIRQKAADEDLMRQTESQAALNKAMVDANNRDAALRKQIQLAAAQQIDPNHWWNSKSTGGKILAGIGMILGGMGGGLAHTGRNPAMEVINNAISNDIDAQRSHIQNSWEGIKMQNQLDDTAFNREMHRQVWENNYRTAGLERVKMELAANAAKTQSDVTRQNALIGIQDLTDAQAKIRNQQYILGQQAAMANLARVRKLSEEAGKQVMELVKEKGVDPMQAEQFVYQQPQFRELMGAGMVPPSVAQLPRLRAEAAADIQKLKDYGYSDTDAANKVLADPKYAPLTQSRGPIVPAERPAGAETEEQLQARTVLVDGNPVQTVNKKAADDWKEYSDARDEAKRLLGVLQASQPSTVYGSGGGSGDPAKYEAARAKLVEILPRVYGYNRGPSVSQVRVTLGPEAVPEYQHWYTPGIPGVSRQRAEDKLNDLANDLNTIDSSMRRNTFPAGTGAPPTGATQTGQPNVNFQPRIDFTPSGTVSTPTVRRGQ